MSFLDNLGQKINDVSQTTIKKTKNLADTAKLNLNISEEERKISTAYEQIGKWYATKHREDADAEVHTWIKAIASSEARIKECRESIHQMKGMVICPACGASINEDAAFCSACGQKLPEKPKPEPIKEADVEVIPPEEQTKEAAPEDTAEAKDTSETAATVETETPAETVAAETETSAESEAAAETETTSENE